jgi:hypothetical protein
MLSPSKRVLCEYKTLVVKIVEDSVTIDIAKTNYELLCDLETLLGLSCIIPLLELLQGLSKFTQSQQTFICDFISALKLCEANLFTIYCEARKRFSSQHFSCFQDLCEHIHEHLCLTWWKEFATCIEYAAFFLGGKLYVLHIHDLITEEAMGLIAKQVWANYVESMKWQCFEATTNLISESERNFLAQELLNATRVIYPITSLFLRLKQHSQVT